VHHALFLGTTGARQRHGSRGAARPPVGPRLTAALKAALVAGLARQLGQLFPDSVSQHACTRRWSGPGDVPDGRVLRAGRGADPAGHRPRAGIAVTTPCSSPSALWPSRCSSSTTAHGCSA